MSPILTILLAVGTMTVVSSLIVAVWALARTVLLGRKPIRLFRNRYELGLVGASNIACIIGAVVLLQSSLMPERSAPELSSIEITTFESDNSTIKEVLVGEAAREWQRNQRRGVIILLLVPVAASLLPWLFYALRVRPIVEALLSALLAAQMAIGMSGYGLAFVPAALLMLVAAIAALRTAAAQQAVPGSTPPLRGSAP